MNTRRFFRILQNPLSWCASLLKSAETMVASSARGQFVAHLTPAANSASQTGQEHLVGAANELAPNDGWFRVSPFGQFVIKLKGEAVTQVFDKEASDTIVAGFNSAINQVKHLFRGLPIYEGHPDMPEWLAAHPGAKAIAVGRIKNLETREDGLWAKPAWNETGSALISGEAAAYSAGSPFWFMAPTTVKGRKVYRPIVLASVGLTNTPNIPDTAIGANEAAETTLPPVMKKELLALLTALGKAPAADATDDQIITAANEATTLVSTVVANSAKVPELEGKLLAAANEGTSLKEQLAAERKARVDAVLVDPIRKGQILEAKREEWATKLIGAANSAGFDAIMQEISKLTPAANTKPMVGGIGTRKGEGAASIDKVAAINREVSAYQAERKCSWDDAFKATKAAKPDLFNS